MASILNQLNIPTSVSGFSGVPSAASLSKSGNNASIGAISSIPKVVGAVATVSSIPKLITNLPSMDEVAQAVKDKVASPGEMFENLKTTLPSLENFNTLEGAASALGKLGSLAGGTANASGLFSLVKKLGTKVSTTAGYTVAPGSFWDTVTGQPESVGSPTVYEPSVRSYFKLGRSSLPALKARGYTEATATALMDSGFWEFIIQSYTEGHAEGYSLKEVMSETFLLHATGANPINISMSGYLVTTTTSDHRIDFLQMYNKLFRGTQLSNLNLVLSFVIKDTVMNLRITNIGYGTEAHMADMTAVTLTGTAYKYSVNGLRWHSARAVAPKVATSKEQFGPPKDLMQSADITAAQDLDAIERETENATTWAISPSVSTPTSAAMEQGAPNNFEVLS